MPAASVHHQKAVATISRKDIANFKLRKKMPIGVMVTLRRERMYEFLEKLVRVALPRIRDFKGIESKFDGKGNYTLGIQEQIIFPEINIDSITRILGMNITFVTSAQTDEEGYALLKEFGLPFNVLVVPSSTLPSSAIAPLVYNKLSVNVVFPAST